MENRYKFPNKTIGKKGETTCCFLLLFFSKNPEYFTVFSTAAWKNKLFYECWFQVTLQRDKCFFRCLLYSIPFHSHSNGEKTFDEHITLLNGSKGYKWQQCVENEINAHFQCGRYGLVKINSKFVIKMRTAQFSCGQMERFWFNASILLHLLVSDTIEFIIELLVQWTLHF